MLSIFLVGDAIVVVCPSIDLLWFIIIVLFPPKKGAGEALLFARPFEAPAPVRTDREIGSREVFARDSPI
jgi:hypothetical protein